MSETTLEIYVGYKSETQYIEQKTDAFTILSNITSEILLNDLQANTRYDYRLYYRFHTDSSFLTQNEWTFQTQRSVGSGFTFCVESYAHLDEGSNPVLFARTLGNIQADQPDFLLDLGDTFMSGKLASDVYYYQR